MDQEFEGINYDSLLEEPTQEQPVEESTQFEPIQTPDDLVDAEDHQEPNVEDVTTEPEDDALTSYLKSRGIEDVTKIQFENDEGEIEEKNWNDLSKEEQLTMLQELSSSDYTDYERQVINYLRTNNTDLQGVIDYFSQKAVDDYLKANPDKVHQREYKIDDYSDDELYIADLKLKFPDFTDDELESKLESAKTNEELFNREVAALRNYYKQEEEREEEAAKQSAEQEYQHLQQSLLDAASKFTEVKFDLDDAEDQGGFEIEDSDRQRALAYLLAQDKDGNSQFDKDLSDPNALFEIAYLRTSARDLITGTSQYYKGLLAETRKELAKTKKALEKYEKKGANTTVTKPSQTNNNEDRSGNYVWI